MMDNLMNTAIPTLKTIKVIERKFKGQNKWKNIPWS